jgi:phosphoribosyl 1,2-cyclic phosphate phosphodiesterase
MKITVLGSGTSHGIPVVGCECGVCRSSDARNQRMRASLLIEGKTGESAVIDTGPEFRLQAVRAGIKKLDAVFLTHAHADHVHGLDDVRPLAHQKPLPVYGKRETLAEVRERFSYIFRPTQTGGGKPNIELCEAAGPIHTGSLCFTPVPVKHGRIDILGWRVEEGKTSAVYLTDISSIPASSMAAIKAPEILFIDGLRQRPHPTHFSFDEALNAAVEIGARHVYLTHICHDSSHSVINEYCGNFIKNRNLRDVSMEAAFDQMQISV